MLECPGGAIVARWLDQRFIVRRAGLSPGLLSVGLPGFEPGTSTSRTWRANQAALQPVVPAPRLSPGRSCLPATVSMVVGKLLALRRRQLVVIGSSPGVPPVAWMTTLATR